MIAQLDSLQKGLLAICGLSAAFLMYNLLAPIGRNQAPVMEWRIPGIELPFVRNTMLQKDGLDIISQKPLFNPTRQPIAETSDGKAAGKELAVPSDVTLVGVIIDDHTRMAMVRSPASPLAYSAAIGQTIEGWTISEIAPDHLTLSAGASTHTILLSANKPSPAMLRPPVSRPQTGSVAADGPPPPGPPGAQQPPRLGPKLAVPPPGLLQNRPPIPNSPSQPQGGEQ